MTNDVKTAPTHLKSDASSDGGRCPRLLEPLPGGPQSPPSSPRWHHPVRQGGSLPLPRSLRALRLRASRSALCSTSDAWWPSHVPRVRPPARRIFTRRKWGEKCRASSEPIVLTREMLSGYFDRPLRLAAVELGISPTALKSLCRKLEVLLLPPALCCTLADARALLERPPGTSPGCGEACAREDARSTWS